jgi:oligoribonuclease NrnB/cAMP/cGMP phosphodiesterase (DHH superfamily)
MSKTRKALARRIRKLEARAAEVGHSVLYHGDWDGICAAYVTRSFLPKDTQYQAVNYEQDVPWELIDGRKVWILDFSYSRDEMKEIIKRADAFVCLDHHATAQKALKGLPGCIFDMKHSGAMMAHRYFHKNFDQHSKTVPEKLVRYVQDRDLWAWKLPHSKAVSAVIGSYPLTFEAWDELVGRFRKKGEGKELLKEGRAVLRDQETTIASLLPGAREVEIEKHKALAVNTPLYYSEIAGELATNGECDFGLAWFQQKDGRVNLSFRSRDSFDVSEVALKFGGGGHKNSAGAKVAPNSPLAKQLILGTQPEKKKEALSQRIATLER